MPQTAGSPKVIVFIDGPRAGETHTVADYTIQVVASTATRADYVMGDVSPKATFDQVIYRPRRIASTGHICHDAQQREIFEVQ